MPHLALQSEHAEVHIRLESAPRSVPNVFDLATRIQKWARHLFPALCRAWLQARLAEDPAWLRIWDLATLEDRTLRREASSVPVVEAAGPTGKSGDLARWPCPDGETLLCGAVLCGSGARSPSIRNSP